MLGVAMNGIEHEGVVGVGSGLGVSDLVRVLLAETALCCGFRACMLLPIALLLKFTL